MLCVIRVSGTFTVAGSFGQRWSVEAAPPRSALRVAYDGVTCRAAQGPDEHQTGLVSKLTMALSFRLNAEYRVVDRLYFRFCLERLQALVLRYRPKS